MSRYNRADIYFASVGELQLGTYALVRVSRTIRFNLRFCAVEINEIKQQGKEM
jgi:hypothetical protein